MKNLLVLLLLGVVLSAPACSRSSDENGHSAADHAKDVLLNAQGEYYTCPMHPSVISDKPGACPICGMSLVKRVKQAPVSEGDIGDLKAVSLSVAQRVMANVATQPARRHTLMHIIDAVGVIEYAEPLQAIVSARFRGRIDKLHVNFTGAVVRKGQPLFEMYSPDLISTQREFVLALQSLDGVSGAGVDSPVRAQAEAMVNAVRDRLRVHYGMTAGQVETIVSTRQTGSSMTFTSPIPGTVVAKEVQEGQYVDEGMLLYQLADLSTVWVYLDVYEQDIRFIRKGQMVSMTTEAYPGEKFTGRVTFIDPVIDPQTRTTGVRVELNNAGGKLKPQMYVRAETRIPLSNALVIPSSALLSTGKRDVVWVEVQSNLFEPRNVLTGVNDGAHVQILDGLKEGELVTIRGGFMLDSESQLQQPAGKNADQAGDEAPVSGQVHAH